MKVLSIFLIMFCLLSCIKKEESAECYIPENCVILKNVEETPEGIIVTVGYHKSLLEFMEKHGPIKSGPDF